MELNDNEFDAAFRKKVSDAEPRFEESAWDKMEQKLKKRERIVFFRNATLVCLAFIVGMGGYYTFIAQPEQLFNSAGLTKNSSKIEKSGSQEKDDGSHLNSDERTDIAANKTLEIKKSATEHSALFNTKINAADASNSSSDINQVSLGKTLQDIKQPYLSKLPNVSIINTVNSADIQAIGMAKASTSEILKSTAAELASSKNKKNRTNKRNNTFNLAISAGPEFNSAGSILGGKPGISAGLTLGYQLTKKLNLQTGLKYSLKDYTANSYTYQFKSLRAQNIITGIDASCAVVEFPITASYTITNNHKRGIDLNAGISSYLMLKEDYTFKYTAESGIADRLSEVKNENQHFLSVVDLSATYFIKLKTNNLKLGIEPFLKIPLTGVGEGKVKLNSSGILLKIRYDLDKKNN